MCVCTWHNIYAGIIPAQYQHSKHMLTPAVKRDALIHERVLNEQSVAYWDAFQNSRVDHDKIIFLWQSCFKWNKLPLCINKDGQCNCTVLIEHINYPRRKCPKHNTFMFCEYWGKWWICHKVSCRLILKITLSLRLKGSINCSTAVCHCHQNCIEYMTNFYLSKGSLQHLFALARSSAHVPSSWPCRRLHRRPFNGAVFFFSPHWSDQ